MDARNIVLIGFMASGKTTVGELLAELTGWRFTDTDLMVEEIAGMPISRLFSAQGEESFRRLERSAVKEAADKEDLIIAVGGGAILDENNVKDLRRSGIIYFLKVSPDEVAIRTGGARGRPLLPDGQDAIGKLMEEREPAYQKAADVAVDTTDRDPGYIARQIALDFKRRHASKSRGA